jgi:hypothetical protein
MFRAASAGSGVRVLQAQTGLKGNGHESQEFPSLIEQASPQ